MTVADQTRTAGVEHALDDREAIAVAVTVLLAARQREPARSPGSPTAPAWSNWAPPRYASPAAWCTTAGSGPPVPG